MHVSIPQAFTYAQVNNFTSLRVQTPGQMERVHHLKEHDFVWKTEILK